MARGMSRAGLDELLDQGANHGNNLYKAHGQPAAHPVAANQTHPTRPDHSRLGGWHGPGRDAHDQSAAKIGRQLDEHNEYNHARQQIREQARQGQAHGRKRSANNLAGWRAGERALAPLAHTRRGKLALLRNGRARLQTAIALADAARHGNRAAAQKLRELRHAGPAHATPAAAKLASAPAHLRGSDQDPDVNAQRIIQRVAQRGLPMQAAKIALMTSMQESGLKNLNYGDRDSLGLFQQRPSCGWGTVAQIMNPEHAIDRFLDGLVKVHGWQHMSEWQACQAVQRSGFPHAYAKHEAAADTYLRRYA